MPGAETQRRCYPKVLFKQIFIPMCKQISSKYLEASNGFAISKLTKPLGDPRNNRPIYLLSSSYSRDRNSILAKKKACAVFFFYLTPPTTPYGIEASPASYCFCCLMSTWCSWSCNCSFTLTAGNEVRSRLRHSTKISSAALFFIIYTYDLHTTTDGKFGRWPSYLAFCKELTGSERTLH